jgi:hypothetical protein
VALSRYIHLNPYSAGLIGSVEDAFDYPWSSLQDYVGKQRTFVDVNPVVSSFATVGSFASFVRLRADYQKSLEFIKHVI